VEDGRGMQARRAQAINGVWHSQGARVLSLDERNRLGCLFGWLVVGVENRRLGWTVSATITIASAQPKSSSASIAGVAQHEHMASQLSRFPVRRCLFILAQLAVLVSASPTSCDVLTDALANVWS